MNGDSEKEWKEKQPVVVSISGHILGDRPAKWKTPAREMRHHLRDGHEIREKIWVQLLDPLAQTHLIFFNLTVLQSLPI